MAGRGPAPKPAHLRARTNRKPGAATIEAPDKPKVPALPDAGRVWHALTRAWWGRVWTSAMAGQYLPSDVDGLGRLAILVDAFYEKPGPMLLAEIRLQEQRFGLSPLDRSRLQWEIARGEEAEKKRPAAPAPKRTGTHDPRRLLRAVK